MASGDSYAALRTPSLWPHVVHEDVKEAWTELASGGLSPYEVPVHVVSAALEAIRGVALVPGFKVRLPSTDSDSEVCVAHARA